MEIPYLDDVAADFPKMKIVLVHGGRGSGMIGHISLQNYMPTFTWR